MSPFNSRPAWNALGFALVVAWFAFLNGLAPLAALLVAAAVHETGHLLALRLCGAGAASFRLSPFGAEIRTDGLRLSYPMELAAVLAGPAADLLGAFVLSAAAKRGAVSYAFPGAFWVLGLFNLLPLRAMDGGRALQLLLSWLAGPDRGERIASAVGLAASAALAAGLALLMTATAGNLWLLPAAFAAAYAAFREAGLLLSAHSS